MRSWGRIMFGGIAVVALSSAMTATAGATPSHPGGVDDTCPEVLAGAPTGGLQKLTSPPAGSEVSRGGVIEVTLRWSPGQFDGPSLHKALDCVTVDGRPSDALSVQERDTVNDGEFTTRMTVPAGLSDGAQLCDRGFVSGPAPSNTFAREKSNDVCFTVGGDVAAVTAPALSAAPTETPAPEASSRPPAGDLALPATSPNQDDSGLGPAGRGRPGTEVAGAGEVGGRRPSMLPRTGATISSTAMAGVVALLLGGLASFAGRRRGRGMSGTVSNPS
ncbi:MAG: LPXTG cell wall anchor domain-containing protein [Actinobacteria bacterium]|nr:LPXTG cell wall anchor domain-containing protein [Actinomycetota bacterium]